MPTFTLRKFILSTVVLFLAYPAESQVTVLKSTPGATGNFKTFTSTIRQPDDAWARLNREHLTNPDATLKPMVADPSGMVELYAERTRSSKYFINPSKPSEFVKEQSTGAIHYLKNGQWNTIDTRISLTGSSQFEASHQEEPVGFDIQHKESFIKAKGSTVGFNNWQLYGKNNGVTTLLASANWSDYSAGDDGLYVKNIFPGIDASMSVKKGGVKTNFIISTNQFSGYSTLIFKDAFHSGVAGKLAFAVNNSSNTAISDVSYKINGKDVLSIAKGVAYTTSADQNHMGYRELSYTISNNSLSVNIDANYINTQLAYGKVVIDPFVQTVGTILQASITGSMNCGSAANSCNYTLNMQPPSGATITGVQVKFSLVINAANTTGTFFVSAGTCSGGLQGVSGALFPQIVNTPDSANNFTVPGFSNQLSVALLPCMPAASCPPPTIPFTLSFFNNFCTGPTNVCSSTYVAANADFSVRIRGNTLTGTPITRSSNVSICAGQSVVLTRSAPTGGVAPFHYSWVPGGQTTPSITVSPTVTTTYTSTITDTCGNVSIDTTTVLVINQNTPPAVVSPLNVCQFDIVQLTAAGPNLRWFTTATGGVGSTVAPTAPTVPGTYNYYVSSLTICGETPRAQITVIVKPKPAPPNVVSPLGLCQYDVVNLTATGQNLRWYYTPTGGQPGVPTITVPTNYEDSLYYYVTQSVNGCESDRARIRVYVSYKPNGIVLPTKLAVCEGDVDSFNYFGNATPPQAVFNWSTANGINHVIYGQGTTGPVVVLFDSAGVHQVRVQVNNRGCLSELASQPVTVRANPRLTFNVKEDGCQNEILNVALNGITPHIDSFKYSFPGAQIVYGAASGGPWGIRYTTSGPKILSSLAYTRGCISRPFSDTIEIHPLPDAGFTSNKIGICAGDSIILNLHRGDSGTRYFFTPDNFYQSGNIYTAIGVIKSGGYVKVKAISRYGCEANDSVLITAKPCCELFFPNAFSPNNDGVNDVFRPVTNGHQEIKTFRIINRWGQVVYETKEDRAGWNGIYNGKEQDMGTYYYYISYKCEDSNEFLEQKGEVMLLR